MIRIRLGDEDRARIGGPEWLEYDHDKFTLAEAEILDDHGVDWEVIRYGEQVTDEDGKPLLSKSGLPMRRYKPRVQRVWVWSALRRAGVNVGFDELDFDMDAVRYVADPPPESPGKDSETSGATTPSSSPDSGTGTPRRRKR